MIDTLRNMPRYIRNTDAFGWQGADGPNGPWRSITPPQSGTPRQTSSPMDDLRQASADVSGVEVLSDAALNVWCAFCGVVEDHGPPRLGLAAALRAAALYCKRDSAILLSLADELEGQCLLDDRRLTHPLADHARAALAESDGPAVPDGREPASVAMQPSDEEIMGLMPQQMHDDLAAAVRAMAEQEGIDSTPAKGVLRIILNRHVVDLARAALARWGRPAAAPVPVSERLPGPEDCDAEGRCWWGEPQIGDSHDATWSLCSQDDAEEFLTWRTKCGWLPAHALPLPAPEGGEVS